jgi:hypothetical protein
MTHYLPAAPLVALAAALLTGSPWPLVLGGVAILLMAFAPRRKRR